MTKKGLSNLLNKSDYNIKIFQWINAFFVWNIRAFIAAANRNNPLLNYLHTKKADVWLEQASQIKSSMGISREKNDKVDSQRIGLYAYKNREDVKLWIARATPT